MITELNKYFTYQ